MSNSLQARIGQAISDPAQIGAASDAVIAAKARPYLIGRGLIDDTASNQEAINALAARARDLLVEDYRRWDDATTRTAYEASRVSATYLDGE